MLRFDTWPDPGASPMIAMAGIGAWSSELLVFYLLGAGASLVLLGQLLLMAVGFDDLGEIELDDGVNILSVRSLTGFFGGFGWTGVVMLENGASLGAAIVAGAVVGGLLMVSIAFLIRFVYSLRESGTVELKNAVGRTGLVHVSVPPDRSGTGQVQVLVQGRMRVVPAQSRAGERIVAGRHVRIRGLADATTLLVEPETSAEERTP